MRSIASMLSEASRVMAQAYSPYSGFKVGSVILTPSGKIYSGCNVENASYSLTLCAESSAIAQMVSAGEREIKEILVIATSDRLCVPCGACRQRIIEFSTEETRVHMANQHGDHKTLTIAELLPESFSKKHLSE